ncbi:enoyl-ACP reductase FabV [Providencia alcalifaciens]|uniref:enoyl-ACP reductase FabV n=1 Tax=Providencia alcalifaciens TaxID=126385 RepID=UPI002B05AC7F|nr:enoyl-ACP reductase FabV [Providencia alcalifaciens]
MIIEPVIKGSVARNCHPDGIRASVKQQIDYVKSVPSVKGPKKVLVIGASSGYGLASRIALAFGCGADTIGVAFEKGPNEKGLGTAGWYNMIAFRENAEKAGLTARNFIGDAFSDEMRRQVTDCILNEFGGEIDLVVYSLASGIRTAPDGVTYRSTLGVRDVPFSGEAFDLEHQTLTCQTLEPVSDQQLQDTIKVMGGEDWKLWIDWLNRAGVLAKNFRTVAYSYIGPESTWPLYKEGALGAAKMHLHSTADVMNEQLQATGGQAHVAVCKAVVTKASAFIPVFPLYIALLYRVMKEKHLHETCIEQMYRLIADCLYTVDGKIPVDNQRFIRLDDRELRPDVQAEVNVLREQVTAENFRTVSDFAGYLREFHALNGFGLPGVDYRADVDPKILAALKP